MRTDDLFNAITNLRDDQVESAKPRPRLRRIVAPIAACLAVCVLIAAVAGFPRAIPQAETQIAADRTSHTSMRLAAAHYPALGTLSVTGESWRASGQSDETHGEAAPEDGPYADGAEDYSDFQAENDRLREEYASMRSEYVDQLKGFWLDCASTFLTEPAASSNKIIAPLEIYTTLGMTAEITTGPAQQEIFDLLGCDHLENLRQDAKRLWNASYYQDEQHTLLHANSVWLRDDVKYHQEVLDVLARDYYADSFAGEMGSEEYARLRKDWIDEKTNGFLSDTLSLNRQLSPSHFRPDNATDGAMLPASANLALTSTTYYKGRWMDEFNPAATVEEIFDGSYGYVMTDFMCQDSNGYYYRGGQFGAVGKNLYGGDRLLLILPDEGTLTDELLADSQCRDFMAWAMTSGMEDAPVEEIWTEIRLKLPKFDITSSMDLAYGLQQMGVQTAFEYGSNSFTPLANRGMAYTAVPQTCRFKLDEEGCEAASFTTAMADGGAAPPEDYVEFTLDRPFLFLLLSDQGLPIYMGVVNDPTRYVCDE